MVEKNEVIVLKLGGSLITDKNIPFSIREEVVEGSIQQIIKSGAKLILIHGGGSFGHPVAKEYSISQGLNPSIENQIYGLGKTHAAMNNLNTYIINKFIEEEYPVLSIQTSSAFIKDPPTIYSQSVKNIELTLDLGLLPILYGDIILEKEGSFSIISGDRIILELCKNLRKYQILKAIFAIEVDGVIIKDESGKVQLATDLDISKLESITLAELGEKIDVTGGIHAKLNMIKKICQLGIPVQIINGLREERILKALKNEDVRSTNIKALKPKEIEEIQKRKIDHLKIPLEYNVQHLENYFDDIQLIHHSLPEVELEQIDLTVDFFNKKISAPICIAAITGGHPLSKTINRILAEAAEAENVIMSVGSQRAALMDDSASDTFSVVREIAPNIPVIGNIGVGQLSKSDFEMDDFNKCIDIVEADVMAVHFNALHELVQDKGDVSYKLFREKFQTIRTATEIPIIAKEVGSGLNQEIASDFDSLGFNGFDVGGAGGTSFAAIEAIRDEDSNEKYTRYLGETFREWGIPTPASVITVRKASQKLIIATGGLRNGTDIAKSIVLGANIGGFAYKFLISAWKDHKAKSISNTVKEIQTLKKELRSSLWLMNLNKIDDLNNNTNKRTIVGKLSQWI